MKTTTRTLNLIDFGMGVLGGLRLHGVSVVSDQHLPAFHGAFKAAYDIVEERFDRDTLRFNFILNEIHGTTPDVDTIVNYWISSSYVTRDGFEPTLRFTGFDKLDARKLLISVPGDEELWCNAAGAFLSSFRGWA